MDNRPTIKSTEGSNVGIQPLNLLPSFGENGSGSEAESPGVFYSFITVVKDRLEISRFKRRVREATSYLAPLPRKDPEMIFKERENNLKHWPDREGFSGMVRMESIVEVDESILVKEDHDEDAVLITKASKVDRMTSVRRLISRLSLRLKAHRPFQFSCKKSSGMNTTNHDEGKDERVIEHGTTICQDSMVIRKARRVSRYRTVRCFSRFSSQIKKLLKM